MIIGVILKIFSCFFNPYQKPVELRVTLPSKMSGLKFQKLMKLCSKADM